MATRNDITGDSIQSKSSTRAYKDNYDAIFGKKETVYASDEAFDTLTELLDTKPEPNQALNDLMNRPKRWAENGEKNEQDL